MLTPQQRATALAYLDLKRDWSVANDRFLLGVPRAPVPQFNGPAAAAAYYQHQKGNPYTGDPIWGVLDFYTDPRRLQAALNAGPDAVRRLFIDCDDVAGWYLAALRQMPGYQAHIMTLIDERIVGSHVICVYQGPGGCGALDTNGHRALPNLDEATLCEVWSSIYAGNGYHYIGALATPYPF